MALIIPELCKVLGTNHLQTIREFVHIVDSLAEEAAHGAQNAQAFITALTQFGQKVGAYAAPYPLCPDEIWALRIGVDRDYAVLTLDLTGEVMGSPGLLQLYADGHRHLMRELYHRLADSGQKPGDTYIADLHAACAEFIGVPRQYITGDLYAVRQYPTPAPAASWLAGAQW